MSKIKEMVASARPGGGVGEKHKAEATELAKDIQRLLVGHPIDVCLSALLTLVRTGFHLAKENHPEDWEINSLTLMQGLQMMMDELAEMVSESVPEGVRRH